MELEEARRLWQQDDVRLTLALDAALLRRSRLVAADTSLKRLSRSLTVELILNAVLVALVGAFAADYAAEPRFWIPAIIFDAYAIASLAASAAQQVSLSRVDLAAAVVTIQYRLRALGVLRQRTLRWTLLVAPLMWLPLLIVGLRALSIDAYATFGTLYLAANAAFGLGVLAAGTFLARRPCDRLEKYALLRSIAYAINGRSLRHAQCAVEMLVGFEAGD